MDFIDERMIDELMMSFKSSLWLNEFNPMTYPIKSILKATNKSHVLVWHDWHTPAARWFVGKSQRKMDDKWDTPMTKQKPPAVYCMTVMADLSLTYFANKHVSIWAWSSKNVQTIWLNYPLVI